MSLTSTHENLRLPVMLVAAALFVLLQELQKPDLVLLSGDVPDSVFSGTRANDVLFQILPESLPHPTGSFENQRVRSRIVDWFERHGIAVELQRDWGCHPDRGRCAWVENIIAEVPGQIDGPYLALMAHYDSTPATPGVGDDMVSAAILMEIARMAQTKGGFPYPLLVVLTDAEEQVLMGARAFFERHPKAGQIAAVLNMEGTGNGGHSLMFRGVHGNADIVKALQTYASQPMGTAFVADLFDGLASDTDMTVARDHGIQAADFGFVGHGNHAYHTMNDNLDNYDLVTTQHHGDNLYGIVRGLMATDLATLSQKWRSYDNFYGLFVSWPRDLEIALLSVSIVLLCLIFYLDRPKLSQIVYTLTPLVLFIVVTLFGVVVFLSLHFVRGGTPMRAEVGWHYSALLFTFPLVVSLMLAPLLNRHGTPEVQLVAILSFWAILSCAALVYAPNTAYLLILPLLFGSIYLFTTTLFKREWLRWLYVLVLAILVPLSLSKAVMMHQWQSYWLSVLQIPLFVLFFSFVMPFCYGRYLKPLLVGSGVVLLLCAAISLVQPMYTSEIPHTMNYRLIQDLDDKEAWLKYESFNPVPAFISRKFEHEEIVFPWGDNQISGLDNEVPWVELAPVDVIADVDVTDMSKTVRIQLSNANRAMWMGVVMPKSSSVTGFTLGGKTYPLTPAWWSDWQDNYVLDFRGVHHKTVEFEIHFDSPEPAILWVFQVKAGLPEVFSVDVKERNDNALPIHDGDRVLAYQELTI